MVRFILLALWFPAMVMAGNVKFVERPAFSYMGKKYHLTKWERDSVKKTEQYLLVGDHSETATHKVNRLEYTQVNDFNAAAQSRIWDLQEKVGKFPYELIVDKEKQTATLNATYWHAPRPGVLEKHAMVFKINPKAKDVVAYEYHELSFIEPSDENIQSLKEADKSLLLDQKYLDALRVLSDAQG